MEGWTPQLEEALPTLGLSIGASRTIATTATLTPVKNAEVRDGYEIQHADVMTARDGVADIRQTRPLEVAREISHRFRDALEDTRVDAPASTAAIEGDMTVEKHSTPSPFKITPKPFGDD